MDPISLLFAAQAAVSAIKRGCEMLSEGKIAIQEGKKTVEKALGDAKAIYKEVSGIWEWLKGLFVKPVAVSSTTSIKLKQAQKSKQDETPEILQAKVIANIGAQMGEFFDIQEKITAYYHHLEETSLTVFDPTQNYAKMAMERALVELQIEDLNKQIRESMVYAPSELKDIYTRFLKMYGRIQEEQEFARTEQIRKARNERWLQERQRDKEIDRSLWALGAILLVLWMWTFLSAIVWQIRTQTDTLLG